MAQNKLSLSLEMFSSSDEELSALIRKIIDVLPVEAERFLTASVSQKDDDGEWVLNFKINISNI